MDQSHIRNFCIIAHIDHGKSTLADRILEMTDTVKERDMKAQILDDMDLERERGITIKLNAVQLSYTAKNHETYLFNLIDTPGHVDFSYEVSRSLAACEGAVLVVDATQGVQAQTLANTYLALDNDLEVIPVINKVDMNNARPEETKREIENIIGLDCSDAPEISARTGLHVQDVLEQIVAKIPAPSGSPDKPLQALVFDSFYDPYRGVIALVRIREGQLSVGDHIRFMATGGEYEVVEAGIRNPKEVQVHTLVCGDVGWFAASIKDIRNVRVGDTVTDVNHPADKPLAGYKKMNPMVYCGLYPSDAAKYEDLHEALDKLQLNDASLQYEP
ncbi:MAG: translation elongation factor 4, partial [Lactimicrobium massiliense]